MTKSKKNYNQLKRELETILNELQHEDTDIDKAVGLHKEGKKLLSELEKYLADTAAGTLKINKVK